MPLALLGQNNNREECPREVERGDGAEGYPKMSETGSERELGDKVCLAAREWPCQ